MKSTYHNCQLCNKVVLCEKYYLQNHVKKCHKISLEQYCINTGCQMKEDKNSIILKSLEISNQIDNFCVFGCPICHKTFQSSLSLKEHRLRLKHNLTSGQSQTKYIISGFSYQCKMCKKLILCDRQIIKNHMRSQHKVKLIVRGTPLKKKEYQ